METKICKKCFIDKEKDEFYKNKKIKGGYENKCKHCVLEERSSKKDINSLYNKEYYINNKDKIYFNRIDKNKEYYINNKELISFKNKEYYIINKETIQSRNKKWVDENKEYISEYKKEYNIKYKSIRNKRHTDNIINNPLYRLKHNIRGIVSKSIKYKNDKTIDIIGCSFYELKIHLESKFEDWMTWENYGKYNGELNYGWDIDHKTPLSSAFSEDDVLVLNHYTNLQPLCSKVNRYLKKDKLDYENMSIQKL
jgi:hypothetical protein